MREFFKKHKKKILCGFLCIVFCSIFTFNCFATNYNYRSYSDLTTTNSTYQALVDMAKLEMQVNSGLLTLSLRTETETHLFLFPSDVFDYIDWHDSYFSIPCEYVLADYYYLNSVPVGYGSATRYFVKRLNVDYFEDSGDNFRFYINHVISSNIDWGFDNPTALDINSDMLNYNYMFLTIVILLIFIIIMRMR